MTRTPDQRDTRHLLPSLLRRSLSARLTAAFVTLSVTTLVLATVVSYQSAASVLEASLLDRLNGRSI